MAEETIKKTGVKYIMAVFIMLFFVLNDLVFDFLFDFGSSDYISFAFTLGAAIIVFYCNYSIRKKSISSEFEKAATFIKSNFDNWQVAFSVLDIICGVISILSGLAFIAAIFKIIKVGYVPIKIVVVTNKGKSLVKAVSKVSLLWTSGRLLSESGENNCKENNNMFKKIGNAFKNAGLWIWANKKSILGTLAAIATGVTTTMAANADIIEFLPEVVVFGINIIPYLAGLIMFGLTELGVTGKGFETIKNFFARIANEKAEKAAEKLVKKEAKAEKAAKEAEKEAKAEEDKKAKKLLKKLDADKKAEEKKKAAEEKKALAEQKKKEAEAAKKAEEEKILARAMELKKELEAKQAAKK